MAQDQYGNYIANIEPPVAPYPDSQRCCLHGDGAPDASLGSDGKTYTNDVTGDFYGKAGGTWYLIGGPGSSGNAIDGEGSPVGVVTPDAVNQFYRDSTGPGLWQSTGLTDQDWIPWVGGG